MIGESTTVAILVTVSLGVFIHLLIKLPLGSADSKSPDFLAQLLQLRLGELPVNAFHAQHFVKSSEDRWRQVVCPQHVGDAQEVHNAAIDGCGRQQYHMIGHISQQFLGAVGFEIQKIMAFIYAQNLSATQCINSEFVAPGTFMAQLAMRKGFQ